MALFKRWHFWGSFIEIIIIINFEQELIKCVFLSLISGAKTSWPLKDHKSLILSQGIKTYRAQKKETNYGCNRLLMEKWWKFSFWLKVLTPRKDEMTSQKALLFAPVTLLILRPLFLLMTISKRPSVDFWCS